MKNTALILSDNGVIHSVMLIHSNYSKEEIQHLTDLAMKDYGQTLSVQEVTVCRNMQQAEFAIRAANHG